MPPFVQARAFWYEWLMCLDAGALAVAADPIGFARIQWDTWSPAGWFDEDEFHATAQSFTNPDWVAITLNAHRSRFRAEEPRDERYEHLASHLAEVESIATPTLMIQGTEDRCDTPCASANLERYFTGAYERILVDDAGHFPHREAPEAVAGMLDMHLQATWSG